MNILEQVQAIRDDQTFHLPEGVSFNIRELYKVTRTGDLEKILPQPAVIEEFAPDEEALYGSGKVQGRVINYNVKGISKARYTRSDLEGFDFALIDTNGDRLDMEFKQLEETQWWNLTLAQKQGRQNYRY